MTGPSVKALVFDIGRVIIRLDLKRAMSELSTPSSLSPEIIWQTIEIDPSWRPFQEGRIRPWEWHQHITGKLGITVDYHKFCAIWNRVLDPVTLLPNSLFATLSRRYRLALLSNTDPIHLAHMESNYDFMRAFPIRIYSFTVGATKPNPAIFHTALAACSVEPGEAIFIDDIPAFVDAARQLGMQGIQFRSADQLLAELRSRGIL